MYILFIYVFEPFLYAFLHKCYSNLIDLYFFTIATEKRQMKYRQKANQKTSLAQYTAHDGDGAYIIFVISYHSNIGTGTGAERKRKRKRKGSKPIHTVHTVKCEMLNTSLRVCLYM